MQTEFGENVSFSMRTFRFIIEGQSRTEEQEQHISCNLYLEPIAEVTATQPADCSCHTEALLQACATPGMSTVMIDENVYDSS